MPPGGRADLIHACLENATTPAAFAAHLINTDRWLARLEARGARPADGGGGAGVRGGPTARPRGGRTRRLARQPGGDDPTTA